MTTFALVTVGWVFFRANNVQDAFYIVRKFAAIPAEVSRVLATKRKLRFLICPGFTMCLFPALVLLHSWSWHMQCR